MANFCQKCGEKLVDLVEFRHQVCVYCLAIAIDRYEEDRLDTWYDEGGA